jgi:UDP-glucose 4-epimerase
VVPLFLDQIAHGGPLTITVREMTRFLLTLDQAVDTVLAAAADAGPGDTYVPRAPAARVVDVASVLMNGRGVPIAYTGIRPGEKVHEIMISDEERRRTTRRGQYYVIEPMLPELQQGLPVERPLQAEYSSADVTLDQPDLQELLAPYLLSVDSNTEALA